MEHSGRYRISEKSAALKVAHNIESWLIVKAIMDAYGSAEYADLIGAVRGHKHPEGGEGFIKYCIDKMRWLVPEKP